MLSWSESVRLRTERPERLRTSSIDEREPGDARDDHAHAQELAGAERAQNQSELHVRLTCKLDSETQRPISQEKRRGWETGAEPTMRSGARVQSPEQEREQYAFSRRFVELRWMAGRVQRIAREDHRPRHVGYASVQLSIDEIADATKCEPRRAGNGHRIGDREHRNVLTSREHDAGEGHPDDGAVKRQASVPNAKEFERIGAIVIRLVNHGVEDPCADEHADDQVADQRIQLRVGHRHESLSYACPCEIHPNRVAEEVHHAVPAYRNRPDAENDGGDVWIRNGHRMLPRGESRMKDRRTSRVTNETVGREARARAFG